MQYNETCSCKAERKNYFDSSSGLSQIVFVVVSYNFMQRNLFKNFVVIQFFPGAEKLLVFFLLYVNYKEGVFSGFKIREKFTRCPAGDKSFSTL